MCRYHGNMININRISKPVLFICRNLVLRFSCLFACSKIVTMLKGYHYFNNSLTEGSLIITCRRLTGLSRIVCVNFQFFFHIPVTCFLRPVPNFVLLPCQTQIKLSFRFKHGSRKPFETIKRGTVELGSERLLGAASLAMPHGSSTTCFQTVCYCRADLSFNVIGIYLLLDGRFVLSFEFGATVLGPTFKNATVLSSCHC